ncbi:MAG: hypothetical protein QOE92_904 [Chloroflexota bacterium]|jgi:uncharacterized repeat protein (TIGR03847 family)|nr:hypothetical protein [Chloroflexota bacterium]
MAHEIDFDPADAVAVGTVGPSGQRAFYIQARSGLRTLTMLVEKVQVQALAERAASLLEDQEAGEVEAPDDLVEPVEPDWRAGQLGLGMDSDRGLVVMVAQEAPPDDADEEPDEDSLTTARMWMRPGQMRAWSERAMELVAAGRPLCALCGLPIDPEGHLCPRKNGKSPVF